MKNRTYLALVVLALSWTVPAQADQMLSLSGHAWETGGFPPSSPGDVLSAVGIVEDVQNPLLWDATGNSYTWHLRDAVSLGETVLGSTRFVNYADAKITFYVDAFPSNHSYQTLPPNETVPSTFADGTSIFLHGEFATLNLSFNTLTQSGSFAGNVTFEGGDVLLLLDNTQALSFAATFGGLSPAGYDLRLIGSFFLEALEVEKTTWARIKSHYR